MLKDKSFWPDYWPYGAAGALFTIFALAWLPELFAGHIEGAAFLAGAVWFYAFGFLRMVGVRRKIAGGFKLMYLAGLV